MDDSSFIAPRRAGALCLAATTLLEDPPAGDGYAYLVTAILPGGEGTLGDGGAYGERANTEPCGAAP